MFSVYFYDLPKVIEAIKTKLPNLTTFCSIRGNFFGDFVIKNEKPMFESKDGILTLSYKIEKSSGTSTFGNIVNKIN